MKGDKPILRNNTLSSGGGTPLHILRKKRTQSLRGGAGRRSQGVLTALWSCPDVFLFEKAEERGTLVSSENHSA